MAIFRYYAIELCAASLDKLFLTDESAKKYRGPIPSQKDVLLQLATGLEYIHEKKVIHRDITPKNILIWVNPENIKQVLLKWVDFGLSKQIVKSETYTLSKVRGAEGWFAPEILKILNDEETSLSEAKQRGTIKSDVFNEGLVFGYYLLKGRHLFGGLPESNIYRDKPVNLHSKSLHIAEISLLIIYFLSECNHVTFLIAHLNIFTEIEWQSARELIKKMIHPDPKERISSSDVTKELRHIEFDYV
jgi:serine/threonine protein kinase